MESAASCVIDADHIGEIAFANFSSCCRSKLRHMEVSMKYGIIKAGSAFLYETADAVRGWQPEGGCADEVFLGWTAKILQERGHSYYVRMFYGYEGYLPKDALQPCRRKDLKKRYKGQETWIVTAPALDVLAQPRVQGRILVRVSRGGLLTGIKTDKQSEDSAKGQYKEVLQCKEGICDKEEIQDMENKAQEAGYILVLLPDGRRGYVSAAHVEPAPSFPSLVFPKKEATAALQYAQDETALREKIVQTTLYYLGTQYCWGGKSPAGTDCSGLAFMSYFMNGILIYRDAQIEKGYPIHEIPYEKVKRGDLLFFPGHVAVSLGGGRFVHSTGHKGDFGVVYGSFLEGEEGYRPDLKESLRQCGSLF